MLKLAGPPNPAGTRKFCEHLVQDDGLFEYGRYYLGDGAKYALVCPACISGYEETQRPPSLVSVAAEKFQELESSLCDGVIGAPSYPSRATNLQFQHRRHSCTHNIIAATGTGERWLGLSRDGDLVDLIENKALCRLARGPVQYDQRVELYSLDGYVIVVNSLGRFGRVHNLSDGRTVLELDRGEYRPEVSRFPIAPVRVEGKPLLIHATDWNQLHITDLRSQRHVNDRQVEDRLDYFHAGLSVSPGGDWIASNGWHWHPMGAIRCWSLQSWLETNPFEPEDGPSLKRLCRRDSYWDGPSCWVDDHTLAVWGHGDDSMWMTPAVLFFDVRSGKQVGWFPGPEVEGGELFGASHSVGSLPGSVPGFIAFDKYFYSVSPAKGTGVWDISTGERLLHDAHHHPVAYSNGQFLTIIDGAVIISILEDVEPESGGDS